MTGRAAARGQLDLFAASPEPVDELDWPAGEQRLTAELARLAVAPRAPGCSCPRPWRNDGTCLHCGRVAA